MVLSYHLTLLVAAAATTPLLVNAKVEPALDTYSFEPLEHLAGIAPYFTPEDPPLDPLPPQGCNVTRAAYLVRHAAIYANDYDYEEYIEPLVEKLANSSQDWSRAGVLSFLADWEAPISDDEVEDLTNFGKLEAMRLGIDIEQRYLKFKIPKKIWTSTAERTVETAKGFVGGIARNANDSEIVQVFEGKEDGANSLTPYKSCPAYSSSAGSDQSEIFLKKYTKPIIARFKSIAPGFNFTATDIYGMQQLCGYESVIRGSSPFCSLSLFPPNDWLAFEYANDIQYHYNTGYGNTASPYIGFPWVNASTHTLFSESSTQDLYISFTHRELPPTVLTALSLFNNTLYTSPPSNPNATMPLDAINYGRLWKSSQILPFLTNIAIEKLSCDSFGFEDVVQDNAGEFYRVLVNSSPQPLVGCRDGPGESCSRKMFEAFVKERGELYGNYDQGCSVDYKNSTSVLSIYA